MSSEAEVRQQDFKSLLLRPNTEVRVKVNDGRVIHGIFSCMDSDLNIILDTAVEYYGNHEIDGGNNYLCTYSVPVDSCS